jgi:7-carboxy-7-deazaguanine synthase
MLNVCEIFDSIQGESTHAGRPCTFIRLTGCNLRCTYCDTQYAYEEGSLMTISDIIRAVSLRGRSLVEITGGEPLLQKETPLLCEKLVRNGYEVLFETNGSFDISQLPEGIKRIMDIKCPGSGESEQTNWQNMNHLHPGDELKFVISNREDYEWAKTILKKYSLQHIPVLFSPVLSRLSPDILIQWILEDNLPVRFQLQLQKIIWHSKRGR